ncbi:MAG: hypothetical protein LUQ01_00045, partial [Methanolinea sp.]|nr:hypothetical protein [Methanolinea sp.]
APPASAGPSLNQTLSVPLFEDGKPVVYFFYNTNCAECQRTLPFMEEMAALHTDAIFSYNDIRESDSARILFQEFKKAYGEEFLPVPSLFVGRFALSGEEEIKGNLEDAIRLSASDSGTPQPVSQGGEGEVLTIPLIVTAALIDGINPCAFAVLIFLLLSLIALDTRKRMAMVGATFIAAVFIFYFFSGLGLFAVIQLSGLSRLISLVAAVIAIVAGVVSIGEAVWKKKTALLSIPESKKGLIETWAKKGSLPAAFVLGVLVGMFELPCTGGIYLAILSMLSHQVTMAQGIPYLLLYNVFFILPLVIILAVVILGIPPERLEEFRGEKRPYIRLAMGAVMILLGIILLWEVL